MKLAIHLFIFTFSILPIALLAQQESNFDLESFIEELIAVPEEDLNYNDLYENLVQYYNVPLNINGAKKEELASLYILTEIQINALLNHIDLNGPLLSIYEIQTIQYFDSNTISKLRHFIVVKPPNAISKETLTKNLLKENNSYLLLRYEQTLEKRRGFKSFLNNTDSTFSKAYYGSPARYNLRFRSQKAGDYRLGVSLEKDAGEALHWNQQNGTYFTDSYNLYYQILNKGRLKNLVLGDYQLQFGQGLLLSGGFSLGKGAETITSVKRLNTGIRAHTSQVESGFLRGVAGTYQISDHIQFTPFFSRTQEDGIVRTDSLESNSAFIRSIQESGLHRTDSELNAKNTLSNRSYGGNVSFRNDSKSLQIGFTSVLTKLSIPIIRDDKLSNQFRFSGDRNINYGMNVDYLWQNFNFFVEAAQSSSGGKAILGGFLSSLSKELSLSFLFRHYDRDFHSLFGQAFSESSSNNINEQGIYIGFKYALNRKYQLSGYFDQFRFPWVQSRINRPSNGYEYLVRGSYTPSKSTILYLQFRQESKARNTNQSRTVILAKQGIKNNFQISFNKKLNDRSGFKSRIQFSDYTLNDIHTKGFALVQDAHYHFGKFKLTGRVALFDTEDFENRQYVYERDLLYTFSLPAYSGVGSRQYLLLQYKFSNFLKAWVRWSNTTFRDRDTISSGQQEIEGNRQNDIKMQLQVSF